MNISKKKFKKLAQKHLVAIEKPRNEFGRNEIKIYGIEELYKAINDTHCCETLPIKEELHGVDLYIQINTNNSQNKNN